MLYPISISFGFNTIADFNAWFPGPYKTGLIRFNTMKKSNQKRNDRLLPNGSPRYVRCYDNNGKTADRYTIVFSRLQGIGYKGCLYLGANNQPFYPQGIGMTCEAPSAIDKPGYSHLGKKIKFESLPLDVKKLVLDMYKDIWKLV